MAASFSKTLAFAGIFLILAILSGCAVRKGDVDNAVGYTNTKITGQLSQTGQPPPAVVVHSGKWLAGREIALDQPSAPEIRQRVRLGAATPASLREIALRISQVTSIPVSLEPDLEAPVSPGSAAKPTQSQPSLPPLPPVPGISGGVSLPNLPIPVQSADFGMGGDGDPGSIRIAYSHDGPLNELLDQITARFGIAWEYKGGRIVLSRFVTRSFTLFLPANTQTAEAEVGGKAVMEEQSRGVISTGGASGGGAMGGGATGGVGSSQSDSSGQKVKSEAKLEPWKEAEGTIARLLTPAGRLAVSPSSGDVVVTDTPAAVKRVADYIEQKNAALVRQIAIQVEVLSVEADDADKFEIQWNMLFKNDMLGTMLVTPDLVTGATANLAMQILRPSSDFYGSQAIVKLLSSALNGRIVQSTVATTLNNQPAPIQVTRTDGFLKATSSTIAGVNGVVSNSLIPGSITTGFQMTVTPRILDRDRLMISYNIDLSRLLGFTNATVGSGDSKATIQIPNFERRAFIQAVAVKAGDTLVLSGFEQSEDKSDLSGPVFPENALFGSRQLDRKRTRLVVLITPVLVGNGSV